MTRTVQIALVLPALLFLAGCASNPIVGNHIDHADAYYGELGVTGNLNQLTVKSGSDLTKLSIMGDANVIHVMERVALGKIEIWGENNKVYIPDSLVIRRNIVGNGNEIIRVRPVQTGETVDEVGLPLEPPTEEPMVEPEPEPVTPE